MIINKKFFTILITLVIGVLIGRFIKPTDVVQTTQAKPIIVPKPFPVDSVILYMKELKIKYPKFTFAQMQHETTNFTSNVFKDNNNLLGLKVAYLRPTTSIGWNRNHAKFKNWRECIIDFALLQTRILAKTNGKDEYMKYIQDFYSEDKNYIKKVNAFVEENKECGIF